MDPLDERDAHDDWWAAHEVGDDPERLLTEMIGETLTHLEFALGATEQHPTFLWPAEFEQEVAVLQLARDRLQHLFGRRVQLLDEPDWVAPPEPLEHGPFQLGIEYLDLVAREEREREAVQAVKLPVGSILTTTVGVGDYL